MPDDDSGVRTRLEIKKNLLRRAMKGKSQYSAREMILLILWVQSRARHVPEDHEKELDMIHEIEREDAELRQLLLEAGISEEDLPAESRTLMRLNLEERRRGQGGNWSNLNGLRDFLAQQPPSPSIN